MVITPHKGLVAWGLCGRAARLRIRSFDRSSFGGSGKPTTSLDAFLSHDWASSGVLKPLGYEIYDLLLEVCGISLNQGSL